MAVPVTVLEVGGKPVTHVIGAQPVTPVEVGGMPVTLIDAGGYPVTLVNEFATLTQSPLTATNVIFIGASLTDRGLSSAAEQAWVATIATQLGFSGTILERATESHTFSDTIAGLPTILDEFQASAPRNVYFMHRSGNDITNNRPYTAEQHDAYLANLQTIRSLIEARGSTCIFGNVTYRPYDSAPTIDPHTQADTDGSLPYNTNVIEPFIRTFNSAWWDFENDAPAVDLYAFTRDCIGLIVSDRVHLVNAQEDIFYEYILGKIADWARAPVLTDMSGRSVFLNAVHNGSHRVRTGNMNWHSWYTGYVVDMDGNTLPGVSIEWRGFSATAANGDGAAAEARIADTRFHGLDASVLVQQTFVSSVAQLNKTRQLYGEVRIHGLEPGQTGTLTMVGTRTGVVDERKMVVTVDGGVTTATLDAATDAASNQIVLNFTVPATGALVIRGDIEASSVFGYFDAAILDFD